MLIKFFTVLCIGVELTAQVSGAEISLEIETATRVRFPSALGKEYQVYATTNLESSSWHPLGVPQNGTGETITFFHTTQGDQKVFFKVAETNGTAAPVGSLPAAVYAKSRLNLQGQDLTGLSLPNADMNNFILYNAKLIGCNLQGADFTAARVEGANFSGADLRHANFSGSSGQAVNFSNADLREATLGGFQNANLSMANLTGARFSGPYNFSGSLSGATARDLIATNLPLTLSDSAGIDFTGSDFSLSWFYNTSFAGANLTRAKFVKSEFSFSAPPGEIPLPQYRINFENANLTDADLTGATGFFEAPGIVFKNTKMPDGSIRNGQ